MRVDANLLTAGAGSSYRAAEWVSHGANRFAGASVGSGMFGDFDRARSFNDAVQQCHGGHVAAMRGEAVAIDGVGGKAQLAARLWVESERYRAMAMESVHPQ